MNVTIYGLIDPRDNRIKYVGKTTDLIRRLYRHCVEKENNFKYRWIASLKRLGLKPIPIILDFVPEETWEQFERMWIAELKNNHSLTNGTDGGDCGPIVPAPRDPKWGAAISKAKKGRKLSEEHREKCKNGWLGKKVPQEVIDKRRKTFLEKSRNSKLRKCNLVSPDGRVFTEILSIAAFAREHNLNSPHLADVLNGKRNHHKGWKIKDD